MLYTRFFLYRNISMVHLNEKLNTIGNSNRPTVPSVNLQFKVSPQTTAVHLIRLIDYLL